MPAHTSVATRAGAGVRKPEEKEPAGCMPSGWCDRSMAIAALGWTKRMTVILRERRSGSYQWRRSGVL